MVLIKFLLPHRPSLTSSYSAFAWMVNRCIFVLPLSLGYNCTLKSQFGNYSSVHVQYKEETTKEKHQVHKIELLYSLTEETVFHITVCFHIQPPLSRQQVHIYGKYENNAQFSVNHTFSYTPDLKHARQVLQPTSSYHNVTDLV